MSSITEFNTKLLNNESKIQILDYVKLYNNGKIEIDFVDKLLDLVKDENINISHTMLYEFGISNGQINTNDIKKIINQYEFKENVDFIMRNVSHPNTINKKQVKKVYYFHPDAFEMCLMRSKN